MVARLRARKIRLLSSSDVALPRPLAVSAHGQTVIMRWLGVPVDRVISDSSGTCECLLEEAEARAIGSSSRARSLDHPAYSSVTLGSHARRRTMVPSTNPSSGSTTLTTDRALASRSIRHAVHRAPNSCGTRGSSKSCRRLNTSLISPDEPGGNRPNGPRDGLPFDDPSRSWGRVVGRCRAASTPCRGSDVPDAPARVD